MKRYISLLLLALATSVGASGSGTVDYITKGPDPILLQNLTAHFIMSKSWCEKHNVGDPLRGSTDENYATRHTNGTGPFMMTERVPGSRTVLVNNPDWWGNATKTHNLTKATFVPIANAATRVSALLTGEVDMIFPVPLQDVKRVNATPGVRAMQGPELRTVFLGFDQHRDELLDMKGSGKNTFKDVRVRRAFYQAIDIQAKESTALEPGGYHVMLMGLQKPLKEGDVFPMTLTFEAAGRISRTSPIARTPIPVASQLPSPPSGSFLPGA